MTADNRNVFQELFFCNVLDQLYTNIYITDVENDEIVYMNDTMKKTFHLEDYRGRTCWEVLQEGMSGRCGFCKIGQLNEDRKVCVWNEKNIVTGRIYKNYDSLIQWEGRTYHVQNSTDITEHVQLTESASTDELTRTLNRRAGKEKLSGMMAQARLARKNMVVVMYDVNGLKQVNDQYGHAEGDRLLRYVTLMTGRGLGEQDFMFRLSGDEFIVVFYDETWRRADGRMKEILHLLKREREAFHIFYEASFSYGMLEVYPEDTYTISDIIERADEKMYIQKRNFHIENAKKELRSDGNPEPGADFEFNGRFLLEALTDSTDESIFVGNLKTGVFRYSPSMVEEFGLPGEVVENAAAFWGALIHPHDEREFLESNQEIADGRLDFHSIEYRARNVRGEWIWLRCRGRMIRDEGGEPQLFAGFITNLGKRNQIDHMTGLYNRFEFEGDIKKAAADGKVGRMGLMLLNLDSFKNINELYDHSFGDDIMRITAQKIASLLPANARVYRLDGDEFGVIILDGAKEEYTRIFAAVRHRFHKQQEYAGKKYYCTVSAGYAVYPDDAGSYLELLKYATYSLEHSKLTGKNRLTRYTAEILEAKERKLELVELLRESVERGFSGFSICYQPQIDTVTKQLYGAEALARWQCEKFGKIPPSEFIPLLEENGLMLQLGSWILYHAARQCKQWSVNKPDFRMSINLSYRQLLEGDLVGEVERLLKDIELTPENITLELTENYLIRDEAGIYDIIERLHGDGIKLAMDDFGVGYSALSSLKNIPVDIVKIDRVFVKGIAANRYNAAFIKAITELCHDMGKAVCLEGVETQEEYDRVKDMGMEAIQGFYFGCPIEADMFEKKWL